MGTDEKGKTGDDLRIKGPKLRLSVEREGREVLVRRSEED